MTGNCVLEAYKLQLANKGEGKVFYVARIGEETIGHAYYIPNPDDLEALAFNQADNGFPEFPALTVAQVLENNDPRYLSLTTD